MEIVGEALFQKHAVDEILKTGDVPSFLLHGKHSMPLGSYLKSKLREHIGMPDDFKAQSTYRYSVEMSDLLQIALSNKENRFKSFSTILSEISAPKAVQMKARLKLYEKVRKL